MFICTTTHRSLKAYCVILVRRSNFRYQASPCVSPRDSTQRRNVELWARNVRKFCWNDDFHAIYKSFTCRKATTWDRRLYFPSEERRARNYFALKIRRFRPVVNPRTSVSKASRLSLDHPSRWVKRLFSVRWSASRVTMLVSLRFPIPFLCILAHTRHISRSYQHHCQRRFYLAACTRDIHQ
jgi:hypothetical protein